MKSGGRKPPLAPKPSLAHLPPPATPSSGQKQVPWQPGRKSKPPLAPKPSLSELNSKVAAAAAAAQSPQTPGQNGAAGERIKPNWDAIIPICLCSQKKCRCLRDSHVSKTESDVEKGRTAKSASPERRTDHSEVRAGSHASSANGHLPSPKPAAFDKNSNSSRPPMKVGHLLFRMLSEEENAGAQDGLEESTDDGSEQKQQPLPLPLPVPRRLQYTSQACRSREEIPTWEGRKVNAQTTAAAAEGKGGASASVGSGAPRALPALPALPASPSSGRKPSPTPRKKQLCTLPSNVDGEDPGRDSRAYAGELSVDRAQGEGSRDREASDKPQTESPAIAEWGVGAKTQKAVAAADLPFELTRSHRSGPSPPARRRSFSGTDSARPEGSRGSFRRLLDLKLSVTTVGSAEPDRPDRAGAVRRSSSLVGVEQSVDGDQPDYADYENYYEEISEYENVYFGGSESSGATWQSYYDDDGIYEEPEVYLDQNAHFDRISLDGEADGSVSDDDVPFSDEDDDEDEDDSSFSSKGDGEQADQSALQSVSRKRKIRHIATEIMTSEEVFVDVLKLLHVDFRHAVAEASRQNGKAVIEERLLERILYYLPQLYQLNRDLLRELQDRLARWDQTEQVADIFLKKGPYLKMYSTYIREFDKNAALLEEQSKKNAPFAAVVRQFEASPRCANLALKHYLLKPIQRIPQYQLLLRDYLKNLPKDSADYKDTQDALAIVREVADHANDIMKQGDNFQKLIRVQCSLNGRREIVQPGRIFLKEGLLNKLSRKLMQPRMFFLFNDSLLYTTPLQSGQFKFNNMLSLAGMKVSRPSQEACQNEFIVESVERSFILSASSASERDEWLRAISAAIDDYTKKKITFISGQSCDEVRASDAAAVSSSLGTKAPIWIPDPRATMCMICTCEFTLTWRRHHCRACGKVVCQSCSSNKQSLEYLKNQLARVCDHCYLALREQQSQEDLAEVAVPKASFPFSRKFKRIPAALKEVTASADNSSMSGYLLRSKGKKKQGKRLWFVIKDKVLYTYAASEDVAALESQPLLGLVLKVDSAQRCNFKLYHKNTLYHNFKADDVQTAQRWINTFRESAIL
ncbi:FYVE, RhoGEF and PH domain-containing protein 6 [Syngnathus scovelli]|uniref:FYVE, RhoGEF and PH domain-containing protein 6 n=1 Tax=Syngnathus scovelli TaxID=161590 RepID=UPI00211071AD|nr:FYVE, RhoGEF and PH domain-containing protein 6 [Syngnathus scovelli]